jgi:hypothetical protein
MIWQNKIERAVPDVTTRYKVFLIVYKCVSIQNVAWGNFDLFV